MNQKQYIKLSLFVKTSQEQIDLSAIFFYFQPFTFSSQSQYIMDSLVEIPVAEWPRLRDLFSIDWPNGAAAYCLLDTNINSPKLSQDFNFKVYCPFGDFNNGMVATTLQVEY